MNITKTDSVQTTNDKVVGQKRCAFPRHSKQWIPDIPVAGEHNPMLTWLTAM